MTGDGDVMFIIICLGALVGCLCGTAILYKLVLKPMIIRPARTRMGKAEGMDGKQNAIVNPAIQMYEVERKRLEEEYRQQHQQQQMENGGRSQMVDQSQNQQALDDPYAGSPDPYATYGGSPMGSPMGAPMAGQSPQAPPPPPQRGGPQMPYTNPMYVQQQQQRRQSQQIQQNSQFNEPNPMYAQQAQQQQRRQSQQQNGGMGGFTEPNPMNAQQQQMGNGAAPPRTLSPGQAQQERRKSGRQRQSFVETGRR